MASERLLRYTSIPEADSSRRRPNQTKTEWGVLLGVVLAGFALRLWLIFVTGTAGSAEVFEYDDIARNLLSGHGYIATHLGTEYRSYYSGIFYIWLTAVLYAAFPPGHVAVLVSQALISSILAVVIFLLGRVMWCQRAGLLAAGLTISHPALVYYDTHKLHPLSFDAFSMSLAVFALLLAHRSRRASVPVLAGIALGVAVLQRGSLLLLIPLGFLWLWFFRVTEGHALRRSSGYALGIMLVITPWVARNYAIHGVPILVTTTAQHFWVGNASHSYGSNLAPSGQTILDAAPEKFRVDLLATNELGQSRLFWQTSLADVSAHPTVFALGVVRKFLYFWTFGPQTGVLYPVLYFYMYAVYYFGILALAILGAMHLTRAGITRPLSLAGSFLMLAIFISVSAVHSLLYFELRHRWAIEPILLIFTSVGLCSAWRWTREALSLLAPRPTLDGKRCAGDVRSQGKLTR